jgi:hypothetical protein
MINAFDIGDLLAEPHEAEKYKIVNAPHLTSSVLAEYDHILFQARRTCPGIVLTGGAVRDVIFDREVKDLDFMSVNMGDKGGLEAYLNEPLLNCLRDFPAKEHYPTQGSLLAAYETEDKRINWLLVSDILTRIHEFPDSISQCWFDGRYVYGTPEFCSTVLSHAVSYKHDIKPERLEKLKSKYPDFHFEVAL